MADEVRNLAMRAAEAAQHTNNLIDGTIKTVKKGSDLTLTTQEAFKQNVEISRKISALIDEVEAASNEQSRGIDQINTAVNEMSKIVQSNAANAEESASAAQEMNAQAEKMKGYVVDLQAIMGGAAQKTNGFLEKDLVKKAGRPLSLSRKSERDAARIIKPDQVIPLNDHESFRNF